MFILMISRGIPTKEYPQWGCFEQDQAESLQKAGHKVIVVSVDSRFLLRWRSIGITHKFINGVDYYNSFWIPGAMTNLLDKRLNTYIKEKQLDRIYKLIEKKHGKPDIIYGQFFFNTNLGVFLKKKYGIPLVGIEHASRFVSDNVDNKSLKQASNVYKYTDSNIAVSTHLANALNRLFNVHCEIVHNVYNPYFDSNVFRKQTDKHKPFRFISIGTLEFRKGFDVLIKAFKLFNCNYPDSTLTIIGEGEERNNLTSLINEEGILKNVFLLGRKSKEEIAVLLSESDTFVLASRSETFGVVFIEAMALGLPVIGTYCGGPDDIVNENNGILVPIDDVNALSNAMKEIYMNYSHYDKNIIINECKSNYSSESIAVKLTNVFNKVLNKD